MLKGALGEDDVSILLYYVGGMKCRSLHPFLKFASQFCRTEMTDIACQVSVEDVGCEGIANSQ